MKSTEILHQFKENYVRKKSLEKIDQLDKYYEENKEHLKTGFIKSVRDFCSYVTKMQRWGEKSDIAYIIYTLCRTDIIEERYIYEIHAYDQYLYYDNSECIFEYDAIWLFEFFHQLKEDIQKEARKYMTMILPCDVQNIMLSELHKFNEYMIKLAKYSISEAISTSEYDKIRKHNVLEICIGEYRTKYELIHREDNRKKDSSEIKEWLEKKFDREYTYQTFKNLNLSNGDYDDLDLSYGNFDSDFQKCTMRRCNLKYTNFHKSNLEYVNFEKSDLSFCCMKDANIKNTNFKWANLKGAIFSKEQQINLSEEQRKSIILV